MAYFAQQQIWKFGDLATAVFSAISRWFRLAGKIEVKRVRKHSRHNIPDYLRRDAGLSVKLYKSPTRYWEL